MKTIIVTSALPYANGDIHLGHLVEYLQADFWVRVQKIQKKRCLYFCADDTHGTPIFLKARQEKCSPEDLIERTFYRHLKDFQDFEIEFDHFSSTNSKSNQNLVLFFYEQMKKKGVLFEKTIEQAYSSVDSMFLPDRLVVGTCPKCGEKEQYGDSCDVCSSTYNPLEMKDARSTLSNTPIEIKKSKHLFFELKQFQEFLIEWTSNHVPKEVVKKLEEWLSEELKPWNISRDEPYFGFSIPDMQNNFFYVWLDALICYLATCEEWCKIHNEDFLSLWNNTDTDIFHFIGKDITYFHSLFWPALLKCTNFKTPSQIFVHGFLTINGQKMSKSKGTFILVKKYLDILDPTYLRFYYGTKLSSGVSDLDLDLEDFVQKINSELIGKIINLGSRSIKLLEKMFQSQLSTVIAEYKEPINFAIEQSELILEHYQDRDFHKALTKIRTISERANVFFDKLEPWKLAKVDLTTAHFILSSAALTFRVIMIMLQPITPSLSQKVSLIFDEKDWVWDDIYKSVENIELKPFGSLLSRLDISNVLNLLKE